MTSQLIPDRPVSKPAKREKRNHEAAQLIPDRPAPKSIKRKKRNYEAAFIYDEPGPRGRRNILIGSLISTLVFLTVIGLALWQFGLHGQLDPELWLPFTNFAIWQYLLVGLLGTLKAAVIVAALASPLGVLLALGRLSKPAWLRWICSVYIEVARTIPVLLMIYLMLFGLPQIGINLPVLWKLAIPLIISNSAAFAEIVRAGILALPGGQREAGLSLGLRGPQVSRLIVLPQAVRSVAPSLVTQFVSLLKDTSLGFVVAYTELLYRGQVLSSYLHILIPTYVAVTVIYLAVNGSLNGFAVWLKRRTSARSDATNKPSKRSTT